MAATAQPDLVWYVSYGSNMHTDRLMCYIAGGTPIGTQCIHPGCRDRSGPQRAMGCKLPGGIYFATNSAVWGGGRAFYDPQLPGPVFGRAYLITPEQFGDIAAQEMYRDPGVNIDLGPVLSTGRAELGPGRYETLLHMGDLEGYPLLTFTAPWRAHEVPWIAPSASYLRMLVGGLQEGHGWDVDRAASYLAELPGARGHWTAEGIAALSLPGTGFEHNTASAQSAAPAARSASCAAGSPRAPRARPT